MVGASFCARSSGQVSCSYSVHTTSCNWRHGNRLPSAARTRAGNLRGRVVVHSDAVSKQARRLQAFSSVDEENTELEHSGILNQLKPALLLGSTVLLLLGCHPALADSRSPEFHPVAASMQDLASNEDFWENLLRYARFFFSVLVGTAYTTLKPVGNLLRRPVTAILVVSFLVGLYFVLNATLKSMLGVEVQEPLPLFD